MLIQQFYDEGLAHASYAVLNDGQIILIDPARDPQPYYNFAEDHHASITGVIETHPHADFVSSHLEIHHKTGANIYASKLTGASYPHLTFDDGDSITIGNIRLKSINTPGHSPDSICILAEDENGKQTAIFTGDTLFVGDVGRPDLRENVGNITAKKEELARQMYQSTREKLMTLPPEVVVYPAHGPGSLCGKNMSPDLSSTIGRELRENYALQLMDELQFVKTLTTEQPFVPKYFGFDVELNKTGAKAFKESIDDILIPGEHYLIDRSTLVIDTRPKYLFRKSHLKGSINLQDGEKFETWLGAVVGPDETFHIIAKDRPAIDKMIRKTAKIGYEQNIKAACSLPAWALETSADLDLADFVHHTENYTVVDVRNRNETVKGLIFNSAITIPLPELRERVSEISTGKPIVVHCAAGYRSAAAVSILAAAIDTVPVYDLGEAVVEIANGTLVI